MENTIKQKINNLTEAVEFVNKQKKGCNLEDYIDIEIIEILKLAGYIKIN
jgi:hypothetical protein